MVHSARKENLSISIPCRFLNKLVRHAAAFLTSAGIVGFVALPAVAAPKFGLDSRPTNPASCVAGSRPVQPAAIDVQQVFANLSLKLTQTMVQRPNDNTRWFTGNRYGQILTFPNDPNAASTAVTTALDLSAKGQYTDLYFADSEERGISGIVFHPNFPTKPYIYVTYNFKTASDSPVHSYLSRFTAIGPDYTTFDPASEKVLIEVVQGSWLHHFGQVVFGPDGYLYMGSGDWSDNTQSQNTFDLRGKVLRFDVNNGDPYAIPSSNPFADGTSGAPEVYAYGLRNPWRFTFDRGTGDLYLGDVGQIRVEEINIIHNGSNYGWPVMEGSLCFHPAVCTPIGELPVHEYSHDLGTNVTGGYVYHGTAIPDLVGTYIFAPGTSTILYGLPPGKLDTRVQLIDNPSTTGISTFAEDISGEIYMVSFNDGKILKIIPSSGEAPPATGGIVTQYLSDTGCVDASNPRNVLSGLIPYDVAAPLWSDDALKTRFLALPTGKTIDVADDGDFILPIGSVLIKYFYYNGQPIETRFLAHHSDDTWGGYSYEWVDLDGDGVVDDAVLLETSKTKTVLDDNNNPVDWTYPSRQQCFQCHTTAANTALGPEIPQLNTDFYYEATGRTANQLDTWNQIKLFTGGALPVRPWNQAAFNGLDEDWHSVIRRARSYLHSNCSGCHRPGGPTPVNIDLRFQTRVEDMGICNVDPGLSGFEDVTGRKLLYPGHPEKSVISLRMHATDVSLRMPPLARTVVDTLGTDVIDAWISRADVCITGPDADNDGVPDNADNCTRGWKPSQRDADHDGIGDYCDGDFDNNGVVDGTDLDAMGAALKAEAGKSTLYSPALDMNGDGAINNVDYRLFKPLYGSAPGPSCCAN